MIHTYIDSRVVLKILMVSAALSEYFCGYMSYNSSGSSKTAALLKKTNGYCFERQSQKNLVQTT